MNFRHLLFAGALCVGTVLVVGCGPATSGACSASNCNGCCDANGQCQLGVLPTACGANGMACTSCSSKQSCQVGACVDSLQEDGGTGCQKISCQDLGANCGEIPDGCGGVLQCGNCSGGQTCGAGGSANVCGAGSCTPVSCADQGAYCGLVRDGCSKVLNCGGCQGAETCGGAGVANVCGDGCALCPTGFTCNGARVCAGGNLEALQLNVKTPPEFEVTGTVTHNGQQPTSSCTSSSRATVAFRFHGNSTYDKSFTIPCGGGTTPLTFTGKLHAGTYEVSVTGGSSSLPSWKSVVHNKLVVTADVPNLVLDVQTPPLYTVTGTVTQDGAQPTSNCSSSSRATVYFRYVNHEHLNKSFTIPCGGGTSPLTFSGQLYAGTYEVSVRGGSSSLPTFTVVALPMFSLSADEPNLVVDVKTPKKFNIAGTVTHNGAQPTSSCTSSSRATVYFRFQGNSAYDKSVAVPCNGATTPLGFSTTLAAGSYQVSVKGNSSSLPSWTVGVHSAFNVAQEMKDVVFDVQTPPQYTVAGTVTQDGAQPTSTCTSSTRATLFFKHKTDDNFDETVNVACDGGTSPFAFTTKLYAGQYEVYVTGKQSSLPPFAVRAHSALNVGSDAANILLDVVTPKTKNLAGVVLHNGEKPTSTCTTQKRATIYFQHLTDGTFDNTFDVACDGASTPFAFKGELYPGTYQVSVRGNSSSLPTTTTLVVPFLQVP